MATTQADINFSFRGSLPASKSLLNRALIIKDFFSELQIIGDSQCEDVAHMKSALSSFRKGQPIDCGEAGTVLRFLSLRVSRQKGSHRLLGSSRLLQRPHEDLLFTAEQLGFQAQQHSDEIIIQSEDWKKPLIPLRLHREKTSQFLSGLVLSAWQLPFALEFELIGASASEAYWLMTQQLVEKLGMTIEKKSKNFFRIPPQQTLLNKKIEIETDASSAFSIAAVAALCGEALIENFNEDSCQPDSIFPGLLKNMNIPVIHQKNVLGIRRSPLLKPTFVNLSDSPDLFPVLAVLCALAEGTSTLAGAPQLAFKESNRIKKTAELLAGMGIRSEEKTDGLVIHGRSGLKPTAFHFNPDQDHRMAMAAGILMKKGYEIQLQDPHVVNKSFPEFWKIIGIQP